MEETFILFGFFFLGLFYSAAGQIREEHICDNKGKHIKCDFGQKLSIESAVYGREDAQVCVHSTRGKLTNVTDCHLDVSASVRPLCHRKFGCYILSSTGRYGNPCIGVYKYLTVRYSCNAPRRTTPKSVIVCENRRARLRCEKGTAISIAHARFGRTDESTCRKGQGKKWGILKKKLISKGQSVNKKNSLLKVTEQNILVNEDNSIEESNYDQVFSTTCAGQGTDRDVVMRLCQNERACAVRAGTRDFGDPCPGVNKYLSVTYWCY